MDIDGDSARARLERWREESTEFSVNFKTNEGSTLLPGKVELLLNDKLIVGLDRGVLTVSLKGATFQDGSDADPPRDSLTVNFPRGGCCHFRIRKTDDAWPDVITDIRFPDDTMM